MGVDRLLAELGNALALFCAKHSAPTTPSRGISDAQADAALNTSERTLASRLMRINHAGEAAAQGLYRGHALTAQGGQVREYFRQSGQDEAAHLGWCKARLTALGGKQSLLDPCWYGGALTIGALTGLIGDSVSLGFVAETEKQVTEHLTGHLDRLPPNDISSRTILERMRADEMEHGAKAIAAGAAELPAIVPGMMRLMAKVMTGVAYWI